MMSEIENETILVIDDYLLKPNLITYHISTGYLMCEVKYPNFLLVFTGKLAGTV